MPICVNGYEITDADIERELPQHEDAANALQQATTAVILRRVLADEAQRQHCAGDDDDSRIDALLQAQVAAVPMPDEASCRAHFDEYPQHFEVGNRIEVDHILFQVTERVDLERLRQLAQEALDELLQKPELFAEKARALSNCPSGQDGGQLGQIVRGATVPEFERVIFSMDADSLWPRLVETRFGLHIIHTRARHAGQAIRFEQAAPAIARALHQARCEQVWRDYLVQLVKAANITGIELPGMQTV